MATANHMESLEKFLGSPSVGAALLQCQHCVASSYPCVGSLIPESVEVFFLEATVTHTTLGCVVTHQKVLGTKLTTSKR